MNAQFDLRNLIPTERPEGAKCCGICGKPDARADKHVKALPHHAAAVAKDLPGQFRLITKALGANLMDFVTREKFNAQLESIRAALIAAREEHDAFVPPAAENTSQKAKLVETLGKTLALVGVKLAEGEHTPLDLANALHIELTRLMAVKAEAEAPTPEIPAVPTYTAGEGI